MTKSLDAHVRVENPAGRVGFDGVPLDRTSTRTPQRPRTEFSDLMAARAQIGKQRDWFAEGAIEGNPIIVWPAPEKGCKSWVALDLAIATITGTAWLDRYQINRPGDVLYFDPEYGAVETARRVERLCRSRRIAPDEVVPRLHHSGASYVLDPANPLLETLCKRDIQFGAIPRPSLVVIDPLKHHIGGALESDQDMRAAFAVLRKLRRNLQCPILVPHHLNRDGSYAGSRTIPSAADLIVEGTDDECPLYSVRGRTMRHGDEWQKRFEIFVEHKHDHDDTIAETSVRLQFAGEPGKLSKTAERMLAALKQLGGKASVNELRQASGVTGGGSAANAIESLQKAGLIQRSGSKWSVATTEFLEGLSDQGDAQK